MGNEDKRVLWLIDVTPKEEVQLTDPHHHAEGDSFSPDGEWIVFYMQFAGEDQTAFIPTISTCFPSHYNHH